MDEEIIIDILNSREDRRNKQIELINKYNNSLISFTLNTPGIIKDNKVYRSIFKEGIRSIEKSLIDNNINIIYKEEKYKTTGPEYYIVVDIDSIDLKELTISIEDNHSLGRIFDIDIFDLEYNQINRNKLGYNPRKCFLCNRDARICSRLRRHEYKELIDKINSLWLEYKNTELPYTNDTKEV